VTEEPQYPLLFSDFFLGSQYLS